jgi:hypothetical protein
MTPPVRLVGGFSPELSAFSVPTVPMPGPEEGPGDFIAIDTFMVIRGPETAMRSL